MASQTHLGRRPARASCEEARRAQQEQAQQEAARRVQEQKTEEQRQRCALAKANPRGHYGAAGSRPASRERAPAVDDATANVVAHGKPGALIGHLLPKEDEEDE